MERRQVSFRKETKIKEKHESKTKVSETGVLRRRKSELTLQSSITEVNLLIDRSSPNRRRRSDEMYSIHPSQRTGYNPHSTFGVELDVGAFSGGDSRRTGSCELDSAVSAGAEESGEAEVIELNDISLGSDGSFVSCDIQADNQGINSESDHNTTNIRSDNDRNFSDLSHNDSKISLKSVETENPETFINEDVEIKRDVVGLAFKNNSLGSDESFVSCDTHSSNLGMKQESSHNTEYLHNDRDCSLSNTCFQAAMTSLKSVDTENPETFINKDVEIKRDDVGLAFKNNSLGSDESFVSCDTQSSNLGIKQESSHNTEYLHNDSDCSLSNICFQAAVSKTNHNGEIKNDFDRIRFNEISSGCDGSPVNYDTQTPNVGLKQETSPNAVNLKNKNDCDSFKASFRGLTTSMNSLETEKPLTIHSNVKNINQHAVETKHDIERLTFYDFASGWDGLFVSCDTQAVNLGIKEDLVNNLLSLNTNNDHSLSGRQVSETSFKSLASPHMALDGVNNINKNVEIKNYLNWDNKECSKISNIDVPCCGKATNQKKESNYPLNSDITLDTTLSSRIEGEILKEYFQDKKKSPVEIKNFHKEKKSSPTIRSDKKDPECFELPENIREEIDRESVDKSVSQLIHYFESLVKKSSKVKNSRFMKSDTKSKLAICKNIEEHVNMMSLRGKSFDIAASSSASLENKSISNKQKRKRLSETPPKNKEANSRPHVNTSRISSTFKNDNCVFCKTGCCYPQTIRNNFKNSVKKDGKVRNMKFIFSDGLLKNEKSQQHINAPKSNIKQTLLISEPSASSCSNEIESGETFSEEKRKNEKSSGTSYRFNAMKITPIKLNKAIKRVTFAEQPNWTRDNCYKKKKLDLAEIVFYLFAIGIVGLILTIAGLVLFG